MGLFVDHPKVQLPFFQLELPPPRPSRPPRRDEAAPLGGGDDASRGGSPEEQSWEKDRLPIYREYSKIADIACPRFFRKLNGG